MVAGVECWICDALVVADPTVGSFQFQMQAIRLVLKAKQSLETQWGASRTH
jgi:hypothetical protein